MKAQIPDDIFALYSHFDLDGENYRVFPKTAPRMLEPTPAASELAPKSSAEPKLAESAATLQDRLHPAAPTESITANFNSSTVDDELASAVTQSDVVNQTSSWAALHNLMRHVPTPAASDHNRLSKILAASSFNIHGVAGGVGATSIAAVLARLLARSGRRVGIFDEKEFSTMPIFFGGQRMRADQRRLAGFYSIFQPEIRLLNRELFEPAAQPMVTLDGTFIERNMAHLAYHFDHLLFNQSGQCADGSGAGVSVYVAIPDVSSILGTRRLQQLLGTQQSSTKIVCVLNRFDFATPLHRELLGWYQGNFPDVITISNSPLIPEALAEGMTVIDWAPFSEVSTDLFKLYKAVSQALPRNGLTSPNIVDPTEFGSERLPLCC